MSAELTDRFWSKVEKSSECWNWTGTVTGGYGQYWLDGKGRRAHRVSYAAAHGHIPEGMQIDHKCHNTLCVNPDHLRVVTGKQNCENVRGAQSNNASKVRGVVWHKRDRRWQARVIHNMATVHVGYFRTLEEAEAAVTAKRNELYTHNDADRIPA